MKRKHTGTALFSRVLAWTVLVLFALTLIGFVGHIGCGHYHNNIGDVCPVCDAFFRYTRLLQLTGLIGATAMLQNILSMAGVRNLFSHPERSIRATLVSLCVKLSN